MVKPRTKIPLSLCPCVCVAVSLCVCARMYLCVAVQKMAEAHMQNLGVYPPLEDPCEGEEEEEDGDCWQGEDSSPTKAAGEREALWWLTAATPHSGGGSIWLISRPCAINHCYNQKVRPLSLGSRPGLVLLHWTPHIWDQHLKQLQLNWMKFIHSAPIKEIKGKYIKSALLYPMVKGGMMKREDWLSEWEKVRLLTQYWQCWSVWWCISPVFGVDVPLSSYPVSLNILMMFACILYICYWVFKSDIIIITNNMLEKAEKGEWNIYLHLLHFPPWKQVHQFRTIKFWSFFLQHSL